MNDEAIEIVRHKNTRHKRRGGFEPPHLGFANRRVHHFTTDAKWRPPKFRNHRVKEKGPRLCAWDRLVSSQCLVSLSGTVFPMGRSGHNRRRG